MISRRKFIGSMTAAGVAGLAMRVDGNGASRQPNIIFILADDLGKEWVSAYGADMIETPNLDKLADTGMLFENAYCMPQCTPTRATFMTGLYPFNHGWVNHWDVPRWGAGAHFDHNKNNSIAKLMREAGYATAISGKWQINDFRVQPNVLDEIGFDDWCMWTGYETGNPPSSERYHDPYVHTRAGSRTYEGKFGPDLYTDFLIEFMRENKDRPMFLYYAMCLPHTPLVATPAEPEARTDMQKHKAMVRYIDHLVGRIVQSLDDMGIREDTILIFTSDNGSTRRITGTIDGRRVRGAKSQLNEPGLCMPFIVNGPGIVPSGVVTDALTDFTDLLPTFVDLAGKELPPDVEVDGISIAPLLRGEAEDTPREWIMGMGGRPAALRDGRVRTKHDFTARAIRDKRFKLVVEHGGQPSELYDLKKDPAESENLLGSENEIHARAKKRLLGFIRQMPEKDASPIYEPLPAQPWDRTESP